FGDAGMPNGSSSPRSEYTVAVPGLGRTWFVSLASDQRKYPPTRASNHGNVRSTPTFTAGVAARPERRTGTFTELCSRDSNAAATPTPNSPARHASAPSRRARVRCIGGSSVFVRTTGYATYGCMREVNEPGLFS